MRTRYILTALLCVLSAVAAYAQADTAQAKGFKRYWNSLVNGNVDRTCQRKMDISFVVAPSYTREGSFGIGGAATALYRLDRQDSLMQPSDLSLSGNVSVKGFYTLSVKGNTNFRGNRSRLSYYLAFRHKNLDFWGVSYDDCTANPVTEYTKQMFKVETDYIYKVTRAFHVGAALNVNYTSGDVKRQGGVLPSDYLQGQKDAYFFTGLGLSVSYDTRDFILNPKRGVYLSLKGMLYPEFMSSHSKSVFSTTVTLDFYRRMCPGSVLALDMYGHFNTADTPWTLREELGEDGSRMRGYYAGRYIDNNYMTAQLELRQHVYGRVGCAAWVGVGTVFSSFSRLRFGNVLPNYGLGLRFEFKHNVNVRVDYGFGKGTGGFVFQFGEAF